MVNCWYKYQAANLAWWNRLVPLRRPDQPGLHPGQVHARDRRLLDPGGGPILRPHTDGQKTDTIYDHVIEGLEFFFTQLSDGGLPLILKADGTTRWTRWGNSTGTNGSCWRIWAECYGDRGDRAYEILHKMMPATRHAAAPEFYRVEPYVACQFICGPESDCPGEGSYSWATRTAAWTLSGVWGWMPGVRPELEGLRVGPCLPSGWTQAKMPRNYRSATYEIEIEKLAHA